MKKPKTIKPFFFKNKTNEEVVNISNKQLPIKLFQCDNLIDRVSAKYPYLKRNVVEKIIISTFEAIRELLILGKILNFNKLFFDTKFDMYYKKIVAGKKVHIKIKVSTPPPMKKII